MSTRPSHDGRTLDVAATPSSSCRSGHATATAGRTATVVAAQDDRPRGGDPRRPASTSATAASSSPSCCTAACPRIGDARGERPRAGREACTRPTATTCCCGCARSRSAPSCRRPTPARPAASRFEVDRGPRRAAGARAARRRGARATSSSSSRTATSTATASVHTALTLRLPTRRRRGGGRAADARERLAGQERPAGALPEVAWATCRRHRLEALGPTIFADLTLTDRRLIDRALNDAAPGVDLIRELDCPALRQASSRRAWTCRIF